MKIVQITLDDDLAQAVDKLVRRLKTNRSAFIRNALRDTLAHHGVAHRRGKKTNGYTENPFSDDESEMWDAEQSWGDE